MTLETLRSWLSVVGGALAVSCAASLASGQRVGGPRKPAQPVGSLPPFVHAAPGEISLFAAFDRPKRVATERTKDDQVVPVYLVNRTDRPVHLSAQDSDLYLKLEVLQDGAWRRAQTHVYSSCGNSYMSWSLPAQHFLELPGWFPPDGRRTKVRYRLHQKLPLISNVGLGWLPPGAVVAASNDMMAVSQGDEAAIRHVALNVDGVPYDQRAWSDPRHRAILSLAQFGVGSVDVLKQILAQPRLLPCHMFAVLEVFDKVAPDERPAHESVILDDPSHPRRLDLIENVWNDRTGEALLDIVRRAEDPQLVRAMRAFSRRYLPERLPVIEKLRLRPDLPAAVREAATALADEYGHPFVDVIATANSSRAPRPLRGPLHRPYDRPKSVQPLRMHAGQPMYVNAWVYNRTDEAMRLRAARLSEILRVEARDESGQLRVARPDQAIDESSRTIEPGELGRLWVDFGKCFGKEHGTYSVRFVLEVPELGHRPVASRPIEIVVDEW